MQLKGPDGRWCADAMQLQALVIEYYKKLYKREPTEVPRPDEWKLMSLPRGSIRWLNREVDGSEIRKITFQIGRHKALSPDGILASFFQTFWPVVGESVSAYVSKVFWTRLVPEDMNESLICLC